MVAPDSPVVVLAALDIPNSPVVVPAAPDSPVVLDIPNSPVAPDSRAVPAAPLAHWDSGLDSRLPVAYSLPTDLDSRAEIFLPRGSLVRAAGQALPRYIHAVVAADL